MTNESNTTPSATPSLVAPKCDPTQTECARCKNDIQKCDGLFATPSPKAAEPVASERAAFEAWIYKDRGDLTTFGNGANMHYRNSGVNQAWTGWQARALACAVLPRLCRGSAGECSFNGACMYGCGASPAPRATGVPAERPWWMKRDVGPHDWPEDFTGENGCYECKCIHCEASFFGYKRRVTCKACHPGVSEALAAVGARISEGPRLAPPPVSKDTKRLEPDLCWDDADNETFGHGLDDIADTLSTDMMPGDETIAIIECAMALPKRKIHVWIEPRDSEGHAAMKWKELPLDAARPPADGATETMGREET